jgi:hypothetical protein
MASHATRATLPAFGALATQLGLAAMLTPSRGAAHSRDTVAVAAPAASIVTQAASGPSGPRLLVQNRYYAKPGKAREVYAWRLHASAVLRQLGLQAGAVYRGAGGSEPDAIWQVALDSAAVAREGRAARESPQFQSVMRHMGTLTRRFESGVYVERRVTVEPDSVSPTARPSPRR